MYVLVFVSKTITPQRRLAILKVVERYDSELLTDWAVAINTSTPSGDLMHAIEESAGTTEGIHLIRISESYHGPAPARVREWLEEQASSDIAH